MNGWPRFLMTVGRFRERNHSKQNHLPADAQSGDPTRRELVDRQGDPIGHPSRPKPYVTQRDWRGCPSAGDTGVADAESLTCRRHCRHDYAIHGIWTRSQYRHTPEGINESHGWCLPNR